MGRGRGAAIVSPCIILGVAAVFTLPVWGGQRVIVNTSPPATEFTSPSPPSNSFTNPQLVYSITEHSGTVTSLTFSPDSTILVSGGGENDTKIGLWNTLTGKKVGIIRKAHSKAVESLVISPDGQTLVSASDDNTINLWNLKTNKYTRTFREHTANVLSLAVTSDNRILASGALDGVRLWDLQQQRPLARVVRFDNLVHTLAISPDGRILATGDAKGAIKLWDLNTARLIRTVAGAHSNIVSDVAFTPDGSTLVSASRDRTIKLWNVNNGKLTRTLRGHSNWVSAIAINPQGNTLASAGRDGIILWNLSTGQLLNTLPVQDWVSAIAFSPNGQMLASGGFDRTIRVWRGN